MSLKKDHLESNDWPCHSKIKGDKKKIHSRKIRRKLNAKNMKEDQ